MNAAKYAEFRQQWSLHRANVGSPTRVLQQFVRRISGATLPIVEEGSTEHKATKGPVIHLGRTAFVEGLGLGLGAKDKQYTVLRRVGDKLVIACGGDPRVNPRGMEFALSAFLMKVLDVHHYLPDKKGAKDPLWTITPEQGTIEVGELDVQYTPSYLSRDFSLGAWVPERSDWMTRNQIAWGGRYHIPHNLGKLLNPAKYAEKHPEFYPLVNGKRKIPKRWELTKDWQPCMSNPGVVEAVVNESRAFFDARPTADLVSLAINDNYGWCECAECRKANGGVKYNADGRVNFSNVYFKFLNAVCRELEKTHPGKLVGAMVYQNGTYTPPDFKLHPNIVVLVVTDYSIFHARTGQFERIRGVVEPWSEVANRLAVHGWHVDFESPGYPRLELKSTKAFLKYYHKAGGVGYHGEEYTSFGLDGPKSWITARLLWDVDQDPVALLRQFCEDCFGPGADAMYRYFSTLEDAWNENTAHLNPYWGVSAPIDLVMTPSVIDACRRALDEALTRAATEKQRRRVRHFRDTFTVTRYTASVARATATCDWIANERKLDPGMFFELTAKLNEAAFGREALGRYLEGLAGDPTVLLDGNKAKWKHVAKPMNPAYCRVASALVTRLAREEGAKNPDQSREALNQAMRASYAALSAETRAKIEADPLLQGLAWKTFNQRIEDFLGAVAIVPKRRKAPELDGVISGGEWDGAPVLTGFYAMNRRGSTDTPADFQTEVRLGYDDQNLYVAYRLTEADLDNLAIMYDKRDATVWNDDSADFAVVPPDWPKEKFYHYIINSKGVVYDDIGGAKEWNSKLQLAPGLDKQAGAWVLEIAVPWKDFGKKPESGQVWRAQFGRSDWQGGKCNPSSWAPTQGGLNNGDYMGILLFE